MFFQTINGLKDFLFSPLVQVHVLGKNLERPFKNKKMEDMKAQADLMKGEQGDGDEDGDGDGEEEEQVVAEEESDGDSSDASDSEDEYDEESEQQSSEEYDEYDSDEE